MTVAAWLGASTFYGSGATSRALRQTASALLGWTDVNCGQGGTGYVNPGVEDGCAKYRDRLPEMFTHNPDVVLVQGTANDILYPVSAVAAEAAQVYAEILAWKPSTRLYVIGMLAVRSGEVTEPWHAAWTSTIRTLVPRGAIWIDPLTDAWLTGTGCVGSPAGDGNADVYLSAGSYHPSQAGHDYLGTRLAYAVRPPSTGLVL